MTRSQLRTAIPMVYGLLIVVLALTAGGRAVALFAVIGGMTLGIYYATNSGREVGEGRQRDRHRNR